MAFSMVGVIKAGAGHGNSCVVSHASMNMASYASSKLRGYNVCCTVNATHFSQLLHGSRGRRPE